MAFQFLILDYYFLGLTYIIVYVGAIAILFLFVIMLIQTDKFDKNIRDQFLYKHQLRRSGEILEEEQIFFVD